MSDGIQSLLKKEMDRKQFLLVAAAAVASLFGVSRIIKLILPNSSFSRHLSGYGSTDYGGKE